MKGSIKFSLSYSLVSILLFIASKFFIKELTYEIFGYLSFYYIVTLSVSIILYPILNFFVDMLKFSLIAKAGSSLAFFLFIINAIPFFSDNGRILFMDLVNGVLYDNSFLGFNNVGIHLISIISFAICFWIYRRDDFWTPNDAL